MASGQSVEVKCREVKRLADLWGVRRDLELARKQCELALTLCGQGQDALLIDGMTTSALVRYMRCFSGGQRAGLAKEDLHGLSEEFRGMHEHFRSLRDRHVAHSVNHYEQCYITASLQDEGDQREHFDGLYGASGRVIQNANNATGLLALIEAVEWVAIKLWQEEHDRALDIVNAFPRAVVEAFKPREPMTVNPSRVQIPRSQ